MFSKIKLKDLPDIYTVNAFEQNGKLCVGMGPEREGNPFLFEYPSYKCTELGDSPGGMMSLVPLPGRDDIFVSVMGLFPPFRGWNGGIFKHQRTSEGWKVEKVVDLPFSHRCDILSKDGKNYLIAATVSSYKENPEDWSKAGEVFFGEITDPDSSLWTVEKVIDDLNMNHGMLKTMKDGEEMISVSGKEGIFSMSIQNGMLKIDQIFDHPVSEFAYADLDSDGKEELVTVEPFHGNTVNIYHLEDEGWQKKFQRELFFGHGLSAGKFGTSAIAVVGNRRGDADLLGIRFNSSTAEYEDFIIDEGTGTTQSQVFSYNGKDYVLCANQLKAEAVLYVENNNLAYENKKSMKQLPGRDLQWLFTPEMHVSEMFSMNVVVIKPGFTVSPAHSHPEKEEIVYIVSGKGKVYLDGEAYEIQAGTTIHFPKKSVHMLRNSGDEDMKAVCFFTPQADFTDYAYHEDAKFPGDK